MEVGATVASIEMEHRTSTEAFCTSCHTMATLASDPHFRQSRHESSAAGVRVGCGDCYIPSDDWFVETCAHVSSGVRDVIAEYTHDFSDPAVWDKRRTERAAQMHDEQRRTDSAMCRKCHDPAAIRPASDAGRAAHAMVQQAGAPASRPFQHYARANRGK